MPRFIQTPGGVWEASLKTEGVQHLMDYLKAKWIHRGRKSCLPLANGGAPLYPYVGYAHTTSKYNKIAQLENTLRMKAKTTSRLLNCQEKLPGLRLIVHEVKQVLIEKLGSTWANELDLLNLHFLRQSSAAQGGSSFRYHTDEDDDGPEDSIFYLSVSVKLSEDPPGSTASSMRVLGFEPATYGKASGSTLIFLSRLAHKSMPTPDDLGHVYKLVLFYAFKQGSRARQMYYSLAPPPYQGPV